MSAGTESQTSKQLNRFPARTLVGFGLLFENLVALVPKFLGNNGIELYLTPFALGLCFPFPIARLTRAVLVIDTFGAGTAQDATHRDVAPLGPCPCPVSRLTQHSGDDSFPAVRQKEFIDTLADGGFLRVLDEFLLLPLESERSWTTEPFSKFRANHNGSTHPVGDFLAFPLCHCGDHGEEQSTGRRARIDGLLKGNHVGILCPENLGEFEQFPGVAGKPGQFGEDETGDMASPEVGKHPSGFRMFHHRFSTHPGKVIDFLDTIHTYDACP